MYSYFYYLFTLTSLAFYQKKILQQRNNPLYKNFTFWWKSIHFVMIGFDPWIKKSINYLSCIEGKGEWKKFGEFHNSTRQLFLYFIISCILPQAIIRLKGNKWDKRDFIIEKHLSRWIINNQMSFIPISPSMQFKQLSFLSIKWTQPIMIERMDFQPMVKSL